MTEQTKCSTIIFGFITKRFPIVSIGTRISSHFILSKPMATNSVEVLTTTPIAQHAMKTSVGKWLRSKGAVLVPWNLVQLAIGVATLVIGARHADDGCVTEFDGLGKVTWKVACLVWGSFHVFEAVWGFASATVLKASLLGTCTKCTGVLLTLVTLFNFSWSVVTLLSYYETVFGGSCTLTGSDGNLALGQALLVFICVKYALIGVVFILTFTD
jgi:hypothetical protein